jgi:NitT/TauT family transport system substrate-binding protein
MKQATMRSVRWIIVIIFALTTLYSIADAQVKELRFGYLVADQLHSPAVMIMKEKKLLEAEGFKVTWSEFLAGSYLMQFLASGEVDFGSGGAVPAIITRGQGVDVVILAGANAEGSSLVVKDSIKAVKDLNGKSIGTPGIGSVQDAMIDKLALDNKIKIAHKAMKVSDMPIFLNKGEIDGFIAWAPHPARALEMGYGHQIITSHELMPGHQCCVLVTREAILKKDPETAKKVLNTYIKAYEWFLANPDESVAMMVKATGMKEEVVRDAMKTVQYPFPPYCNVPSLRSMTDGLVETGKVEKEKFTNMDDFINGLYRPQLLAEVLKQK